MLERVIELMNNILVLCPKRNGKSTGSFLQAWRLFGL